MKFSDLQKLLEEKLQIKENVLLTKLQEIYFDVETKNLSKYNRISLQDFENSELKNVYRVSSTK